MAAKSHEKIIFGVALLALLSSAAWTYFQQPKLAVLRKAALTSTAKAPYVPSGVDAPTVSTSTWPAPPSQTHGPEWIYEVFTPPEIYYNAVTKEFTVTPPTPPVAAVKPVEKPFGVELVQVKQDVFRLQLVGYVGNAGDYVGTFENALTGDTFLARAGKSVPALGLTIRDFGVKRTLVPAPDSMPIYETVATAVVVDDKTGETVTLTNKKRLIKGSPMAILKASDGDKLFEQKADTSFMVGNVRYTVRSISTEPPSAEVTKESPDSKTPVTKSLTVGTPSAPESGNPDATQPPAPAVTPALPSGIFQ